MKHCKKIYKRIKISAAFCAECDIQIRGNGSQLNPYNCNCGNWEVDMDWLGKTGFIEYIIKKI